MFSHTSSCAHISFSRSVQQVSAGQHNVVAACPFTFLFGIAASAAQIAAGARGDTGVEANKALTEAILTTAEGNDTHQPYVSPMQTFIVLQGASMLLFPVLLVAYVNAMDGASAGATLVLTCMSVLSIHQLTLKRQL